tara:strand:+ start:146 stop:562 length:417 start_codon:yes stop_codon:yes gene_type:complete
MVTNPFFTVEHKGEIYAYVLRADYDVEGLSFLNPASDQLQIGIMKYNEGHSIVPHSHLEQQRIVYGTPESLIVRSGSLLVTFYDEHQAVVDTLKLHTGDIILLLSGGHGFTILEDSTTIVEIKQGPYLDGKDKVKFDI